MPIRSGPFSLSVPANGNATRQLVFGNQGAVYRFFNSTDRTNPMQKRFALSNAGASGAAVDVAQPLHATMSIDVAVGPTDDAAARPVGIRITATNGLGSIEDIEGSFDLLRDSRGARTAVPSRSGRFNFPTRVPDSFLPVMIVDLTHSAQAAIYRVYNTGGSTFQVFVAADKNGAMEVRRISLPAKQTTDIDLSHGTVRKMFVARAGAGEAIRGVFELVG